MSGQNINYPFIRNDALAQSMCHSELAECSLTVSSCRDDIDCVSECGLSAYMYGYICVLVTVDCDAEL